MLATETPITDAITIPSDVEDELIHATTLIDLGWWSIAHTLVGGLDQFPDDMREAARAQWIKRASILIRKRDSTTREAVRAGEIFRPIQQVNEDGTPMRDDMDRPVYYYIEHDPRYAPLGWSHFTRAARAGNRADAIIVLDSLIFDDHAGMPPSVARAERAVNAVRTGRTRVVTDDSGATTTIADVPDHDPVIDQYLLEVTHDPRGRIIRLPDDADFVDGDSAIVYRAGTEEE